MAEEKEEWSCSCIALGIAGDLPSMSYWMQTASMPNAPPGGHWEARSGHWHRRRSIRHLATIMQDGWSCGGDWRRTTVAVGGRRPAICARAVGKACSRRCSKHHHLTRHDRTRPTPAPTATTNPPCPDDGPAVRSPHTTDTTMWSHDRDDPLADVPDRAAARFLRCLRRRVRT